MPKNNTKIVVTRTPLRISFFGGGTDIDYFYKKTIGEVFSTTINKYIYVTVKDHGEIFAQKYRLNYSISERKNNINKIKNNIIRETLKYLKIKRPLYISSVGDLPNKSGLGSSSSFTVGLIKALCELEGKSISKKKLAEMACHIEIKILKNPIGKQDQYAAAYGGANHFTFLKNSNVKIKSKKEYDNFIKLILKNSLLLYTGITRNASAILSEQKQSKNNFIKLLKIKKICTNFIKNKKKLNLEDFIKNLENSWKIKKDLSKKTTNSRIEKIYNLAKINGARGVKLLGAGGGGFFLIVLKNKEKKFFSRAMSKFKILELSFEKYGSKVIFKN